MAPSNLFLVLFTFGLFVSLSAGPTPSCLASFLNRTGIPQMAADMYANTANFSSMNVTTKTLIYSNDQLLETLGFEPEHRALIRACGKRCLATVCPQDYECMYRMRTSKRAMCCRWDFESRGGELRCLQLGTAAEQPTTVPPCGDRRAMKKKLKSIKNKWRKADEELKELRAALERERALHRETNATLRNKVKTLKKKLRNLKDGRNRDCVEPAVSAANMNYSHMLTLERQVQECRLQLGWPILGCRSRQNSMASGEIFDARKTLVSSDNRFKLEITPTGVKAYDMESNVWWSAPRSGRRGNYKLTITKHGTIEVVDHLHNVVWRGGTPSSRPIESCLVLGNDRSLGLYGSCGRELWKSRNTAVNRQAPSY